ncbi:hypothetical protein NIES39_A07390 [Arthrospira platensis NIES-39]|nr:hypothetical protein NIES39_A07390 [Arthrospira platensis NIES-39]
MPISLGKVFIIFAAYIKFCNKIIAPADGGMGGGCRFEQFVVLLDNGDISNFLI